MRLLRKLFLAVLVVPFLALASASRSVASSQNDLLGPNKLLPPVMGSIRYLCRPRDLPRMGVSRVLRDGITVVRNHSPVGTGKRFLGEFRTERRRRFFLLTCSLPTWRNWFAASFKGPATPFAEGLVDRASSSSELWGRPPPGTLPQPDHEEVLR